MLDALKNGSMGMGVVAGVQLQGGGSFPAKKRLDNRVRVLGGTLWSNCGAQLRGKPNAKTVPRFKGRAGGVVREEGIMERSVHIRCEERKTSGIRKKRSVGAVEGLRRLL